MVENWNGWEHDGWITVWLNEQNIFELNKWIEEGKKNQMCEWMNEWMNDTRY